MKHTWFAASALMSSLLYANIALAEVPTSGAMLQEMSSATRTLNYELSYISISKQGIESLRYRHAVLNDQALSQLLHMDGPRREILQRGNQISYFEPGLEPFTLNGDHIVDALPSIVFANFDQLAKFYDFIPVGRTRIADRACEVVRVVARDGSRYSYIVWLDVDSKLPLRVDLQDRDGDTLEQYRVINLIDSPALANVMEGLQKANLPPLLTIPTPPKINLGWNTSWLPEGMYEQSQGRRKLPGQDSVVESRLYTDGLFSFTVNVNDATKDTEAQYLRQGRRTVQSVVRSNKEITIVGDLPPTTIKRIADGIQFSPP